MLDPIIVDELELLERVKFSLAKLPPARSASEAPILRELARLREVMLSGDEDKDRSSLSAQWHHQSSLLRQLRGARTGTGIEPGAPYFGHLRLLEGGRELDICLGKATCIQRGLRIVDWRDAPISSLFYGYRQGEEYDEEIAGRERVGRVSVRRMVRIASGKLERVQAPEGDFVCDPQSSSGWSRPERSRPRLAGGEASALRAYAAGQGGERRLGSDHSGAVQRADKRLPEITSLIDPEQFDLIKRPSIGFLVIRGAAGSGKTTVALHRVAYLAFDDPRIDGPDTLVAVFSEALRQYVGHVLPSLGLHRVKIVAYREWAADTRGRHFPRLPRGASDAASSLAQRLKLHPLLADALATQVQRCKGEARREQAFDDWASVLTLPSLLREVRDGRYPGAFSDAEIERFCRENRGRLDDLTAFLAGDQNVEGALDPEDDVLLLRAWQLRVGDLRGSHGRPLRYRHVVLDEVQDFAPLEVQVLLDCLAPKAGITLAGDTQQHISQSSGFSSWGEFLARVGVPGGEVETLRVNYRSSEPISRFAFSLLGALREEDQPPTSTRSGPPVELFRFGDRGACAFFLAEVLRELVESEPLASVALLTPSPAISAAYFAALEKADLPQLRWVQEQNFSFAAGIEVSEIVQAKGLEFDYVLLVDVDAVHYPDEASARRRLHVGATRAIHQLWLLTVGTPSPLLSELEPTGRA